MKNKIGDFMRYIGTLESSLVRTMLYNVLKANFYDNYREEYMNVFVEDITEDYLLGLHRFGVRLLCEFNGLRNEYLRTVYQTDMTEKKVKVYRTECQDTESELEFVGGIAAGFASPASDYLGESIDVNKLVIKNKDYTFIGRIEGVSMIDASLNDQDLVVIDRSLEPRDNDMVVAYVDGEFTIKFVSVDKEKRVWLVPANGDFPKIEVKQDSDFRIWGVVTYSITKHRK